MRCFIAINLDDSLRKEIDKYIGELKAGNRDVRWVPPENLHITLKFLGETPEDSVKEISEKLSSVAAHHKPLRIKLHGVGVFPDRKRPRVIWIDLLDAEGLLKIKEQVEKVIITLGFNEENRSFSPHLTIGRIRELKDRGRLLKDVETLKDKDFGNIDVKKISLMRSDLKPTGAQYTALAEFNLNKEDQ